MNLKNYNQNIIDFIVLLSLFLLDRLSKLYVIYLDNKLGNSEIYLTKFFNIQLIWNDGIAFGLFAFNDIFYYNALTGIIIIVTFIVLFFMIKTQGIEKYCFMMILGGSLGNIFDRLYYSAVPDFIDLHYQNFHWFIFNVADIFITSGVLLLIFLELFLKKKTL
ncbi:signal peptidase II [Candidatus Pelagibacter sp.]|nr:signal peptidase II [Candidatus Pelagibacter sp.]|tara:strand:+ start:860 stop:1348 length:489 start_codon:yes stop_codon:yes gene_type:complete